MKYLLLNIDGPSENFTLYWNEKGSEWDVIDNATIYDNKTGPKPKKTTYVEAPIYIVKAWEKALKNDKKKA